MTYDELRKKALHVAFCAVFVGVNHGHFPVDAEDILRRAARANKKASDLSDEGMNVWEPFKNWTADEIQDLITDMVALTMGEFKEMAA